jgi:hypothetical protein
MTRPRKESHLRLDVVLRVPVTKEQKALIDKAIVDEPEGFAAWARRILLDAARKRLMNERATDDQK